MKAAMGERRGCHRLVALALGALAALALGFRPTAAQECSDAASHPEWIFCHDFEVADADQFDRYWNDIYGAGDRMWLINENPPGIAGQRSLRLAIQNPSNEPLAQGVTAGPKRFLGRQVDWETIYYRRYLRFGADFHQGNFMHLGGLSATHPRLYPWGCMGGAGKRPAGDACFSSNLEPWSDYQRLPWPGRWGFYSYYYRMHMDCGHPGPNDCYGDMFAPDEGTFTSRGAWHVLEMSLDPGTPGEADGSQTFWIDGRRIYTASGIAWRTVPELRVNLFGLYLYIHNNPARTTNVLDVDNVVVSRAYIGPAECAGADAIGAPCRCGSGPDPTSGANVFDHGYCCGGAWQDAPCRPPETASPPPEPSGTATASPSPEPSGTASPSPEPSATTPDGTRWRLWLPWLARR